MAFMNQERKNERAPAIKKILKEYGQKGSLSVRHYSTLKLKIRDVAGMFEDRFENDLDRKYGLTVNHYWVDKNYADKPEVVEMLVKLREAMFGNDYFDESDAMTDYFHTSHYINIEVLPGK